jgi:glutathionyl-hydroquinone reductase
VFKHSSGKEETEYLREELIKPIENAGKSAFQTDLERWAHIEEDTLKEINHRLSGRRFLTGEDVTDADKLLYQTLLRHDYIYYYLYKLNFAKTYDFENIARYIKELKQIEEIAKSIDIEEEKKKAFLELTDERNPYHLVFSGPDSI